MHSAIYKCSLLVLYEVERKFVFFFFCLFNFNLISQCWKEVGDVTKGGNFFSQKHQEMMCSIHHRRNVMCPKISYWEQPLDILVLSDRVMECLENIGG